MRHVKPLSRPLPLRAEITLEGLLTTFLGKVGDFVAEVVLPTFNRIVVAIPSWMNPFQVVTYT